MFWAAGILFLVVPLLGAARQADASASSSSSSSSSTSSAPAPTHSVQVGSNGLVFTPTAVIAKVGDVVEFRFYPQNHSVARADFKTPCIPYEDTGPGRQGFWSGFRPLAVVLSNPPTFQVLINDTDPIFFYCSAPGACINDGMVGVINPNSTETFAIQEAYAKNSSLMFSPGEYFPAETSPASTTTTASSTSSSTVPATATATTSPSPTAVTSSNSSLSSGAIAGISIGGAAVLVIAAALLYICGRQRTIGEIIRHNQYASPPPGYLPGQKHLSMASSAAYPPKIPNMEVDALGFRRFSAQGSPYDRSAAETESFRSRSPPVDETREPMIPSMNLNVSPPPGPTSPPRASSPFVRRPVPQSPGRQDMTSPMTPSADQYQPMSTDIPQTLRVNRASVPAGPHELSVESDRGYLPYKHPEFRG